MKRLFSKYSRYIFIAFALCSVSRLLAMEETPSQFNAPRQIRLAELDEYRAQLIKMIWIRKSNPSCDEDTRANLSFFEETLKNVERELRLLLDPDIQNSAVTIAYPIFQYIPVPLPMAMPMHPGMLPMPQPILDRNLFPEINPIIEHSPVQPDQTQDHTPEIQPAPQQTTELTTQQEQIGGILKRPSHPDQTESQISLSTKTPVKTYASAVATPAKPVPEKSVQQQRSTTVEQTCTSHAPKAVFKNRFEHQQQVETSKLKKTKTEHHNVVQVTQIVQDKKQASTQKEKKKSQITPEKQQPQTAPSTTQVKERVVLTTPAHEKEHKAKSEKTKTKTPKQEEATVKETKKEVVVQPSEPEEEDASEEESVDSHKSEPQTKEKPKLKQKSQKQKKKSHKKESSTQPLVAAAASSNPQCAQTQSAQTEKIILFSLWEHGIELLKQLPSIEDDLEKRNTLSQAISLFEQVFSLRPDINSVIPVDMDQIEGLVKFLYECFAHNPLVQALIIRINLLTDFDFENVLKVNKHDFIQNFIVTISEEDVAEQTEDKLKTLSSIWLVQGCLTINGIETERSENHALTLLSKIIENQVVSEHVRTEAVELLAQIAKRLAKGTKPNPEKDIPLLKMCYKLIPHLIVSDNVQMATSVYIIAEQFSYELFTINHERIYSRSSGESCSNPESWEVIISSAEQALQSKISENSTQKKSKKQKGPSFTPENKNELCALSALCFGKTLRHLKYGDLLDSEITKLFLEKAELYLDVIDVTQIARGNPFNFTLAKVYDILSELVVHKGTIDKALGLKYLRIACRFSPESKVYKFDFATKLLSINPVTKTELEEALSLLKSLADEITTQTRVDPICVQAAFMFASIYNSGPAKPVKGFRTNEKLALEYLALAANAGHPDAMRILMANHEQSPALSTGAAAPSSRPN
ncbi:MAG: hypothetical protein WCS92_00425 [Candidatus Babeliales bacterium]|jgi:chemotaxis protein histidine kinase CheA